MTQSDAGAKPKNGLPLRVIARNEANQKKNSKKYQIQLRVKQKLLVIQMSRQQKNAFTMHSNDHFMLRKKAVTMPFGRGEIPVYAVLRSASRIHYFDNHLINLIINLI